MKRNKSKNSYAENRALAIVNKFAPNVERVLDASQSVSVEVTAADCKQRGRKNHGECAMAEACKRELGADQMIVSSSRVYVIKGKTATRFVVPISVAKEIVSFDRHGQFEPGEYHLQKPGKMQRLGQGYSRGYGEKKTKRAKAHYTAGIRASIAH